MHTMGDNQGGPVTTSDIWCGYVAAYGSTQGPYRQWTAQDWADCGSATRWAIMFPGADVEKVLAEARANGCVGVWIDIETRWEEDPWTIGMARAAARWLRGRIPVGVYAHRACIDAHFRDVCDAFWYAGESQPTELAPNEAVQWGYFGSYDLSSAGDWILNPTHNGGTRMATFDSPPISWDVHPSGQGCAFLTADGAVYVPDGTPASYLGGINPGNKDGIAPIGKALGIRFRADGTYVIATDAGRTYAFPVTSVGVGSIGA